MGGSLKRSLGMAHLNTRIEPKGAKTRYGKPK
jgi:hypothetical protein